MLLMKKRFFDAIRSGRKTTTIRYWRRRMVRPESIHRIRGLGLVKIDQIQTVTADSLTEDDARADGFARIDELMQTLSEIYPELKTDQANGNNVERQLYLVKFTYLTGRQ